VARKATLGTGNIALTGSSLTLSVTVVAATLDLTPGNIAITGSPLTMRATFNGGLDVVPYNLPITGYKLDLKSSGTNLAKVNGVKI
jgi:hypothetical protein